MSLFAMCTHTPHVGVLGLNKRGVYLVRLFCREVCPTTRWRGGVSVKMGYCDLDKSVNNIRAALMTLFLLQPVLNMTQ